MVPPTQLDPTEQDALVKQIGLAMLRAAPEDWDQVVVDYRSVGRYAEADGEIVFADDEATEWQVPPEITAMFARLRAGMYRDGRGTWFNARYKLEHPSSYNLDYDREEPQWHHPPPPQAYADDLRTFPRSEENVPEWLVRRASAPVPAGPPPAPEPQGRPPRFRVARIFDGPPAGNGRPMVNRPPVPEDERAKLLGYLNSAPMALQRRELDLDRMAPDSGPMVPVAFHTDGRWIWPAAVSYYLHNYGVPAEPDLVEHVRRMGFSLPVVDEPTLAAANAFLAPPAPSGPPVPPPGAPPMRPPVPATPPQHRPAPMDGPAPTMAVPRPPVPAPEPPPPPRPSSAVAAPQSPPPAAALPSQGPPAATIDALRARLTALGVPAATYRIGSPFDQTWTMEQTADGWRVGWFDRDFVAPAMFEDVADAAAFLLGKIMLDSASQRPALSEPEPVPVMPPPPMPPQPPPMPMSPPPPPAEEVTVRSEPVDPEPAPTLLAPQPTMATSLASSQVAVRPQPTVALREPEPEPRRTSAQPAPQRWPIQPAAGEPPLTLFRGKRMVDLAPGTEIDRYGEPDGNLAYVAGTPFGERSLVPEWINRPLRTYRVNQPLQALTGTAIPWFEQVGGGTAYLLPAPVADLLADGSLVEVTGQSPPAGWPG